MRHREYTNKAGAKAYITEVIVQKVVLLGGKPKEEQDPNNPENPYSDAGADIPF